jgi:predicted nuclease of predicted toxin-antitoxin system
MLRLAADENFNGDIVRGLLRRNPQVDIVRVQDVGLSGANDPTVLEWAAIENRVVVTHDVSTLAGHAFARVTAGQRMPGVFAVRSTGSISHTIEDLVLLSECSLEGEWEGRVQFLPL